MKSANGLAFESGLDKGGVRFVPPAVDVLEDDDGLTVLARLPGIKRVSVDMRYEDEVLTIRTRFHRDGRMVMPREFTRQFELSRAVDVDQADAALEDGVLRVWIPLSVTSQRRRLDVVAH